MSKKTDEYPDPHETPGAYFQTSDVFKKYKPQRFRVEGILKLRQAGTYRVVIGAMNTSGEFLSKDHYVMSVTGDAGDQIPIHTALYTPSFRASFGRANWCSYGVFGESEVIPVSKKSGGCSTVFLIIVISIIILYMLAVNSSTQ